MAQQPSIPQDVTTTPAAGSGRRGAAPDFGMLAVAVSALVLVWGANRFTFFDDEAFSLRRYVLPMGEMVSALFRGVEPDPPLYYIIENAWIGRVGASSPLLMRIPSIAFFIAGLFVLRRAAAAWFGAPTGRIAQALAALHPAHLLFGMAARWYSLMFLAVAVLLWMTAIATRPSGRRAIRLIGWSLAAGLVCYTNYFGVAVVGLAWLAGILATRWSAQHIGTGVGASDQSRAVLSPVAGRAAELRRWVLAGFLVAALYAPWLPAFYRQVMIFPRVGGGVSAYAASAGRTALALSSGNLASPTAWWVHGPMAVFAIIVVVLGVRSIRRVWPIVLIVVGSIAAGIASQTMLDKYVLSLSGPLCVLVAAVLVGSGAAQQMRWDRRLARIAAVCLGIGWIGCGAHLASGRYWSSLRWLDPFDDAATVAVRTTMGGGGSIIVSHPAAAYYTARCLAGVAHPDGASPSAPAQAKRAYQEMFEARLTPSDRWSPGATMPDVLSPLGAGQAIERHVAARTAIGQVPASLRRIVVIEAAEFQDDAGWAALRARLVEQYSLSDRRSFLPDPDAALKDRLDPRFKHPRFRIVLLTWDLK